MTALAILCGLELVGTFLIVKVLLDERDRAEQAWSRERADLLQRIQAPQHAVTQHYNEGQEVRNPPAVRTDDDADEDWWKAQQEMAESREELAERLMAEEQRG